METDTLRALTEIPGLNEDPLSLFKKSILDQNKDYPPPIPVINLYQNGEVIPFLTKKSFSLWQGKQKSKKTTCLAITIAYYIGKLVTSETVYFKSEDPGKVIFFDNEQGESYAARTMRLILKLADFKECPNLIYCDLREFSPLERIKVIKAGIENTTNVKLVVIDGIVDLMEDFMDAKEGHTTVTDLLKLCSQYDIHIAGVLHQNKGATNKDARAHVGSISSQKCEREIMSEVDNENPAQSIITSKESRGLPFEQFAIRWDKGTLPYIVQDWIHCKNNVQTKNKILLPGNIPIETHKEIIAKVLKVESSPKYKEIFLGLKNEINSWYGFHVADTRVREYLKYYVDNNLLFKIGKTPHTLYRNISLDPIL
jgi:hypothetical protein